MVELDGARFADLYAGSGAVGLEALSRGASFALLVEADARAARVIRDNIVTLRVGARARLVTGKVSQVLAAPPEGGAFDVVFADPPYTLPDDELAEMQRALVGNGWLAQDAVVVIERSTRSAVRGRPGHQGGSGTLSARAGMTWAEGITADRSRRYGETTLWYGRRS
jgi:16S rRNA (guanine966-N2)-methyltransferase